MITNPLSSFFFMNKKKYFSNVIFSSIINEKQIKLIKNEITKLHKDEKFYFDAESFSNNHYNKNCIDLRLIFRATRNGYSVEDFKNTCKGIVSHLILFKFKNSDVI